MQIIIIKNNIKVLDTKYCPFDTSERRCGDWCPLFKIHENHPDLVASIYCGCERIDFYKE